MNPKKKITHNFKKIEDIHQEEKCFFILPDELIHIIITYLNMKENAHTASSCLKMWRLANSNIHWFKFIGLEHSSINHKNMILSKQDLFLDAESDMQANLAKEYFLRLRQNITYSKRYIKNLSTGVVENTQPRNLLINTFKHIILSPNLLYELFIFLKSPTTFHLIDLGHALSPYTYPLWYPIAKKIFSRSITDPIQYQEYPNIKLTHTNIDEFDILSIQNNSLLIIQKNNEGFSLHYMDSNKGYATHKIKSHITDEIESPHYNTLRLIFSSMMAETVILDNIPNHIAALYTQAQHYTTLINLIREIPLSLLSTSVTNRSVKEVCFIYAMTSIRLTSINISKLFESFMPLSTLQAFFLGVAYYILTYFSIKYVIENHMSFTKTPKADDNPNLHYQISRGNQNTYFQPITTTEPPRTELVNKKSQ